MSWRRDTPSGGAAGRSGEPVGERRVVLPALCVFTLTPRIRTLFHFPFPLLSQLCALGTPPPRPEMAWAEAGRRRAVVMAWKSPTSRCLSLRPGGTDSPPQGHRVVVRTPTPAPPPPDRRGKHFCLMLESLFRLLVALEQGKEARGLDQTRTKCKILREGCEKQVPGYCTPKLSRRIALAFTAGICVVGYQGQTCFRMKTLFS